MSSTPSLTEFDPRVIPWQYEVIRDIRKNFDYGETIDDRKVHEILLSGSVGSAKSLCLAHIAITHCLFNPGAKFLLGRQSMPDLKSTILSKVLEHMDGDLVEGRDYTFNRQDARIDFKNKSQIITRSWHDKQFRRHFRSVELSGIGIEELTENDVDYWPFYEELRQRIPRLPHVKENIIVCATNPDSPSHPAHDYFIKGSEKFETRHVYYSLTTDNPFLGRNYVNQLLQDLDERTARRMVYGEWIHIDTDVIYHSYSSDNFKNETYKIDTRYDVHFTFDFNIGEGKPMSATFFQFIKNKKTKQFEFHFFNEAVVEGADTLDLLNDMAARGLFDYNAIYRYHGDGTGHSRHSASKRSDYDIIEKFLANYRPKDGEKRRYIKEVNRSNPPVRERHNLVNGYCKNSHGQVKLFVYRDCPTLDEGLRKVKLKKGGSYVEDDRPRYQHVTTAAGYGIVYCHNHHRQKENYKVRFY